MSVTLGALATGCCSGLTSADGEKSSCASCGQPEPDYCPSGQGGSTAAGAGGGGAAGTAAGQANAGGGASGGGGSSGAPSAPVCNELPLDAPAIDFTYDQAAAPEPQGGELADGTYFLTAEIAYEAPPLGTVSFGRTQVTIAGNVWQEASGDEEEDSVNPDRHSTSSISVSGSRLTLTRTCPGGGEPESVGYTATDAGFTLIVNDRGKYFGSVFTKQ